MPDSPSQTDLDCMLDSLQATFAHTPSILPDVQKAVAGTSIAPTHRMLWSGSAVAAMLALSTFLWTAFHHPTRPPGRSFAAANTAQAQIDHTTLSTHLSLMVGPDAVLVAWSCTGATPLSSPRQSTNYIECPVSTGQLADGTPILWSLFVARPDIVPILQPPAIRVASADGRIVQLGAQPRPATLGALDQLIQSSSLPSPPRLQQLQQLIQQNRS